MTAEIGRKARASVKLTFAATVLQGLMQAVFMIVLARLLDPSDYGYYAVALSISTLTIGLISNTIERALIVQTGSAGVHGISPVIVALLATTGLLTVAVCALLAVHTRWAVQPEVLAIICAAQAIAGAAIVPRVLLRRELTFGRIVAGELAGQFLGGGLVAVALAGAGFGAYALALGFLTQNLISVAVLLRQAGRQWAWPRFDTAGDLVRSAADLGKLAALEVSNVQLPPILLSVGFGASQLGLYNRVSSLVTLPVQLLTSSMSRVMVSAMVAVADDRKRLARAAGLMLSVATAIVTPIAFGIAGSAHSFTGTVLGPKWMGAVPLVPVLAVVTWSAMTAQVLAVVAEAARAFSAKIRIQILSTAFLLGAMLTGSNWGLLGAAIGIAAGNLLFLLLHIGLASRVLNVGISSILRWIAPGFGAGLACFASAWGIERWLDGLPSAFVLAMQIGACAAAALLFYALFARHLIHEASAAFLPASLHNRLRFRRAL